MNRIIFDAIFGDEIKKVEVAIAEGTNEAGWQISVDHYHHGVIVKRANEYCYVNDRLDADDIQAIVDRILEFKGEPWHRAHIHVPNHPRFPIMAKYI